MAQETEKIHVIPLKNKGFNSSKAAPTAIKRIKKYLTKHMKVDSDDIWIDDSLNKHIWSKGKYKMPSKIRVKAVKFEDGVVEAYLPELEFKKSRREILKEEKEKKEPILREGEEIPGGEEEVPGAEDYEIAPAPDGDVKIKKKKGEKKKEESTEKEETDKEEQEKKEETKETKEKQKKEEPKEGKEKQKKKKSDKSEKKETAKKSNNKKSKESKSKSSNSKDDKKDSEK